MHGPEARPPTDAHLDDRLAVKYLFLANEGDADRALVLEPFNATNEQNDYEVRNYVRLSHKLSQSDVFP